MDLIRKQSSEGELHARKRVKLISPVKSSRFDALEQCQKLLEEFRTNQSWWSFTCFFQKPVDPVLYQIPTYFDIIKHPIDLQTMHDKFEAHQYKDEDDFAYDMRLMFENCYLFNGREHQIAPFCKRFQDLFEEKFCRIKKAKERSSLTIFDKINQKEAQIRADIAKYEGILEELKINLELVLKQRIEEEANLKAKQSGENLSQKQSKSSSQKKLKRKASNGVEALETAEESSVETATSPKKRKKKAKRAKIEKPLQVEIPEPSQASVCSLATLPSSPSPEKNVKVVNEDLNKPDSEEDDTAESMTEDELRDLSININSLPPEELEKVVPLIRKYETSLQPNENEELEVDIKALKPVTLRALEKFVNDFKRPKPVVKPRALGRGKTIASVTNQKQLQEEQRALQKQLEDIEKKLGMAPKKKTPPPPPSSPVKESSSSSDSDSDDSSSSSSSSSSSDNSSDKEN